MDDAKLDTRGNGSPHIVAAHTNRMSITNTSIPTKMSPSAFHSYPLRLPVGFP